jgi:hypothetical protein
MITLNQTTRFVAITCAASSGAVACYGLAKTIPGSEPFIVGFGILLEAIKLTAIANLGRDDLGPLMKASLVPVIAVLMISNIAGVSGLLSSAYQQKMLDSQAHTHHTGKINDAAVADLKAQIAAADTQIREANAMLLKAREDKDRAKAANAALKTATLTREALQARLSTAIKDQAQGEAEAITAGGEFGAVAFLAQTVGITPDLAARIVIVVLSSVPDVAACLLLLASTPSSPKAPLPQKTVETMQRRAMERRTRKQVVPPAAKSATPVKKPVRKNVTIH